MTKTQAELFGSAVSPTPSIILELSQLGPIPSFKNQKRAFAWIDSKQSHAITHNGEIYLRKRGLKAMARPITLPEHQKWMEKAIELIACQLRSVIATEEEETRTGRSQPYSMPWSVRLGLLDDAWTHIPSIEMKCELVEPGKEGASLVLEPLN